MPVFLEYDKTSSEIRRIITADEPPQQVAYLAYQQVPDGVEIDLSMRLPDILDVISNVQTNIDTKESSLPRISSADAPVKHPSFLEM
jgi:hypothetical protein